MIQHRKLYFFNSLQYGKLNIPLNLISHCIISNTKQSKNQILYKDINLLLGKTYDIIIFKDILNITPNTFCIAAGTICKNGILILISEYEIDELKKMDFSCHKNFFGNEKIFFKRFFDLYKKYLSKEDFNFVIKNEIKLDAEEKKSNVESLISTPLNEIISSNEIFNFENKVLNILGSNSQKLIFKKLIGEFTNTILISERGCGKSALLGVLSAFYIIKKKYNVEIINPSETFFIYFNKVLEIQENELLDSKTQTEEILKNSIIDFRNSIEKIKETVKMSELRFKKKVNLFLNQPIKTIYLVDEAASLPLNQINDLLNQNVIFSTTIQGYEGTGKSFVHKIMNKNKINILKLEEQMRFDKNDCLDNFMNEVFFLDSEIQLKDFNSEFKDIELNNLTFQKINKQDLIQNEEELQQICSLLVSEHYRNSPDDLLFLLDSPNVEIFVLKNPRIIAILCYTKEGKLEIKNDGNLIPHLFEKKYFDDSYFEKNGARIIRIVVHPNFRNKNLGSKLINYFIERNEFDFVGVSYGLNEALLNFWLKNQFIPVNLGKSINPITNEFTVVMLYKKTNPCFYTEVLKLSVNRYKYIDPLLMLKLMFPIKTSQKLILNEFEIKKINFFKTKNLDCCFITEILKDIAFSQLFNDKFGVLEVILLYTVGINNWTYKEYLNYVKLDSNKLKSVVFTILNNVVFN